jgi:hypothetical protein
MTWQASALANGPERVNARRSLATFTGSLAVAAKRPTAHPTTRKNRHLVIVVFLEGGTL